MDKRDENTSNRSICWLASFPKSGNTWTRALLSNLIGDEQPKPEGRLISLAGSISSNRPRFDEITGITSSDLTDDEIDLLRPQTYHAIAKAASERMYIKVHDAFHENQLGNPIFPAGCSFGAIYLVRHPFDVAVSYAYHQGHTNFAKVVDQLNSPDHVMAGGRKSQLRQMTQGWKGHYRSWHNQTDIPVLTIKYEDMIADTTSCLLKMVRFLELPEAMDAVKIAHAVDEARFDKLQKAEEEAGFSERPEKATRFFRSGRIGEGIEVLDKQLQKSILDENSDLMSELGYL